MIQNHETRIKGTDSIMDVVVKMSEGNPGCITFLMQLLKESKNGGALGGLGHILLLDTLGLYGSKVYMLWSDCCNRDITQVETVLRNWQMGNLSAEQIHENLSLGYGRPFENLVPLNELLVSISSEPMIQGGK